MLTDHICDYCGESFATSHKLGGHVTAVHRRDQIVTDADVILDDIRRVADKLEKPPTAKEMSEHGEYSQRVCQNKFGSWNEALREAGYAPNRKFRLTDQDLVDEIDRLAEQLGRPPSSGEMDRIGKYHRWTYDHRFGGWEEDSPKLASHNHGPIKNVQRFRTGQIGRSNGGKHWNVMTSSAKRRGVR